MKFQTGNKDLVFVIASEARAWQSTIVNSGLPRRSANSAPRNDNYRSTIMRKLFLDPLGQSHCADGADEAAEVASDTFGADDVRLSSVSVEADGLVTAV